LDGVVNKENVQFLCQRINVWFMRKCIMHRELKCGSPSQVMQH
jgi:hypothetical protein